MTSWIYIFSKFTPEALLFEALLICVLVSSYAAFWVVRKRRFGAVENEVPASVVKVYLNELIGEAEDMRAQLFGLLSGGSPRVRNAESSGPSFAVSGDAAEKLAALERKMSDQAAAMEKILSEKAKLEKELSDARAGGASAGGAPAGNDDLQKLLEKCQGLEARLAEYSVIEDDLANLKRLQQENAQLKSQLGGGAAATPTPSPAPAPAAAPVPTPAAAAAPAPTAAVPSEPVAPPAAAAPAPAAEPAPAPAADPAATAAAAAIAAAADAAAPSSTSMSQDAIQAALDAAAGNPAAAFEGLVDEVEKSLQPGTPPAGATAAPAAAAAPAAPETKPEKTDEDLIAEFEKMLNS